MGELMTIKNIGFIGLGAMGSVMAPLIVKSGCNVHGYDIKAKIDWGYAKDYVETAHKIMQLTKPDIFIIASGKSYSVEYFAKKCFEYVGLNYKRYLRVDKKLFRKSKTVSLIDLI